jgi:DNA helicase-2/ATP-dependent DNA helicase PcrA
VLDRSQLNDDQRRAVTTTAGPLLVVAGPGAGKTTVIAARAAYLVQSGLAAPEAILAVTFTNRAGRELRARLAAVLGEAGDRVWAGTFHAFALRLLRRRGDRIGLDPTHLTVYADADDRRAALRRALQDLNRDLGGERPDGLLARIGRAKARLESPEEVAARDPDLAALYAAYQAVLARRRAVEFDDFLPHAVRLLTKHPDVLAELHHTYRYLLVDEYQDVALGQHRLLTLLAARHRNLCVVGDPLQSIFSFRGSDIRFLLDFGRDYHDAAVVTLDRSYRATRTLLEVANALGALLDYGHRRLWTAGPPGTAVVVKAAADPHAEAAFVVAEVRRLLAEGAVRSPADCAVLYRTNAQARELELACLAAGLPYRVRGDGAVLSRESGRDVLAYLRLAQNPHDTAALGRVINTPPRRLAALGRRVRAGEELTLPGLAAAFPCGVRGAAARQALAGFLALMEELRTRIGGPPAVVLRAVLDRTGYRAWLAGREDGEGADRQAQLDLLLHLAERTAAPDLAGFLDELSLATDLERGSAGDALTLSTIHGIKGLEYPVVFIAGMEEGLLPHARALAGQAAETALDEELRLCYVAVTRARERLYLTLARRRVGAGGTMPCRPSRFLRALPSRLVERRLACVETHRAG